MARQCPPWRLLIPFDVNWKESLNYSAMRSSRQNSCCAWQLYVLSLGKSCLHNGLIPAWWLLTSTFKLSRWDLKGVKVLLLALWQSVASSLELDCGPSYGRRGSDFSSLGMGRWEAGFCESHLSYHWLVWYPTLALSLWKESGLQCQLCLVVRRWCSQMRWDRDHTLNGFSWQRTEVGAVRQTGPEWAHL